MATERSRGDPFRNDHADDGRRVECRARAVASIIRGADLEWVLLAATANLLTLLLVRLKSDELSRWLTGRARQPGLWGTRLRHAVRSFTHGLQCLSQDAPVVVLFAAVTSAGVWLTTLMNVFCGVRAMGLPLSLASSTLVVLAQSAGMLIPSGPANIGVYQFTTVAVATQLGVSRADALGLSVILHAGRFFPTTILGLGCLWRRSVTGWRSPALANGRRPL